MTHSGRTMDGKRIAIIGRLAHMNRRELAHLLRRQGAIVVDRVTEQVDMMVLGEAGAGSPADLHHRLPPDMPPAVHEAVATGRIELVRESHLWQRLGLVEEDTEIHHLYTPAMLAELLRVPLIQVRRWYRRGWLRPAKLVHKVPYFDFQEVTVARRLAELQAAGASAETIQRQLAVLSRTRPDLDRPLGQLPVRIEGKRILLWDGDRLMEPGGQLRMDFDAPASATVEPDRLPESPPLHPPAALPMTPAAPWGTDSPPYYSAEEMVQMAMQLEEAGQLREAAEMFRAALAAAGPSAELCFQLAELLYRMGDLSAARERYYMAIELDEDFVEARCNLGCLLAETGETELALAAFQGALAYHPQYADAHYHLARLLDEMGRSEQANHHWHCFLTLAPESPWVQQARTRLAAESPRTANAPPNTSENPPTIDRFPIPEDQAPNPRENTTNS